VRAGGLRGMFIVHPAGRQILRQVNATSTRSVYVRQPIEDVGNLGESMRELRKSFRDDLLEHGKLSRFFSP